MGTGRHFPGYMNPPCPAEPARDDQMCADRVWELAQQKLDNPAELHAMSNDLNLDACKALVKAARLAHKYARAGVDLSPAEQAVVAVMRCFEDAAMNHARHDLENAT